MQHLQPMFSRIACRAEAFAALLLLIGAAGFAVPLPVARNVNVLTYRNDNARTGQNLNETLLSPACVKSALFGKLGAWPVDGYVYAQPLAMSNVHIPGRGLRNVVYVATEHDSVYAFDADSRPGASGSTLWHVNFLDPANQITTPTSGDVGTGDIIPEIGITGTPVIDPTTGTLFVVAKTKQITGSEPIYTQKLHALDVATGLERFGSPVTIQAAVPGKGDGSEGGTLAFNALREHQRPGLLLLNGAVTIAWASHGDNGPYHGWVIRYDARTLRQTGAFNTSPNGGLDGIWEGGCAPSADSSGNIYVATGNGPFDVAAGSYGDSFLKLSTAGGLTLTDYFTPFNQADLNNRDADLGSGGILLLPEAVGSVAHRHLLLSGGKEGKLYLVDRDNMGHINADRDAVPQVLPGGGTLFGAPAYYHGAIYFGQTNNSLKMVRITNGRITETPLSQTATSFANWGCNPSISANGAANGIVWAIEVGYPGVLHAYDAADLSHELYNSRSDRDDLGPNVKFSVPTIANGRVYVGTANSLVVYGLLNPASTPPAAPTDLSAQTRSSLEVALRWTNHADNATGINIERATGAGPFILVTTIDPRLTSFQDTGLLERSTYQYRVRATNSAGISPITRVVTAKTLAPEGARGLVGYWRLDEGVGVVARDASGNDDNGALEGEVTRVAGVRGGSAVSFHAVGQAISHVAVPDRPALRFSSAQSFTLTAWANPTVLTGRRAAIVSKSRDNGAWYGLGLTADGRWMAGSSAGDLIGGPASRGWRHLALVQDADAHQRRLFVDGIPVASGPAVSADGTGDLWIGGAKSVSEAFAGAVGDVRLYNIALTEADILALASERGAPVTNKR